MENAIYRIIDANFNRAREALRVMEEFCRFALNSKPLSARTKQLRHQLSNSIRQFDSGRLISSRDTVSDVGVNNQIEEQRTRQDLQDCFTAACKRLVEALRVLSEITQTQDRTIAVDMERLRYEAYTLEKDIVLLSEPLEKYRNVELYIILTSDLPSEIFALAHKCAIGGADCIQLRSKNMPDDILFSVANEFVKICKDSNVISIINDRVDISIASDADGVHFGQNDLPISCIYQLQLKPMIIGKSTHSLAQLESTCQENPTYVGLGPVFSTMTKPSVEPVGLEYVEQAVKKLADYSIGHAAIGGITLDNVEQVLSAGADCISVCQAVTKTSDPAGACGLFKEKIKSFKEKNRA